MKCRLVLSGLIVVLVLAPLALRAQEPHRKTREAKSLGKQHQHDHATDHATLAQADSEDVTWTRFVGWTGRLYPILVHFPIAMLLGAALKS